MLFNTLNNKLYFFSSLFIFLQYVYYTKRVRHFSTCTTIRKSMCDDLMLFFNVKAVKNLQKVLPPLPPPPHFDLLYSDKLLL